MADEEEKKEGEGEEEAPPKKSKKKLIIILLVLLLVGGGGGAFAFMGGGSGEEGDDEEIIEEDHANYAVVELDPFIVNLSENASFLKIKIMIEYDLDVLEKAGEHGHGGGGGGYGGSGGIGGAGGGGSKEPEGLPGVLGSREPMIRDAIIRVLSSKRAEQVLSTQGKETLKEEIIDAINEAAGTDDQLIVNVYFLDFIIQ